MYGEIVAFLWDSGDQATAIQLEALWNELATHVSFSPLCAYPASSFAGEAHADALEWVSALHSAVLGRPAAAGS